MDEYGKAIYQYAPPSPEEQDKKRRLDAAFAAGAAMLAASGGNRNLAQALGAGGLAAANSRYNSNAAARDDMVAGYQMEQLQRQNAQQRELEQALPELIKAQFAPEAVAGAVAKAPRAAMPILKMVDERNKAKLEQTKIETEIQDKRLKVAEKFANQASYLAKGTPTPQQVQKFAQSLEANGVQGILGQVPFQSWANPDEAKRNLSAMASMFYDIKDRMSAEETARSHGVTEAQTAARDSSSAADRDRNYKLSAARFGLEQSNANKVQFQTGPNGEPLLFDPRRGTVTLGTVTGAPGGVLPPKMPEAQKKELMGIDQQIAIVAGAKEAVQKNPSAFSMGRGMATMAGALPESIAGRFDKPDERIARSYVFNNVSKVINERAGAAQSAQELARLRSFLPGESDSAEQIMDKFTAFEQYLADLRGGTMGAHTGAAPAARPAAPQRKVVKTGKNRTTGRTVVQYDDGTLEER
jgi:hypothetical protein